jgi:oligosaccharide reducing-end xylanase
LKPVSTILSLCLLSAAALQPATGQPAGPSAATGQYRNLVREVRPQTSDEAIDAKLDAYWASLFEGDDDSRVYYPSAPTAHGPSAYILDVGSKDVRSEGMSYGMMIAVQMNKKPAFDALWNWAATHMRYETGPRKGYFRWQCLPAGCAKDTVPASDGEEYIATALLMAASRWGNGEGIYDYARQANDLLDTMLHKEDMNGGVVDGVRSMFSAQHDSVVFVPIGRAADFSDPSYHLPAFYELWARRATGWKGRQEADRARWRAIAETSRRYFDKAAHPVTALTPDYAEFDGRPRRIDGHGDFRYDAFRTGGNWAVDQAWWGKNPGAVRLSRTLLGFFDGQTGKPYPSLYAIDGTVINPAGASGLVAGNAVAALVIDGKLAARYVDDLWHLTPPKGEWRYYNGLLQFMAVLHVSGRFKAY